MPLVICTIFFIVLFSCEGFWYSAREAREKKQLQRYEQVEHPRSHRNDRYLDADWS